MGRKLSRFQAIKYILKLIKPYWYLVFLSIIFSSLASFFSGAIAWFVKPLFDKIFLPQNYRYLKILPLVILVIFAGRGIAVFLQSYFMRKASYALGKDLRIKIYKKLLRVSPLNISMSSSGDTISRIINDTSILESLVGDISKIFFLESLTIIILIVIAVIRCWQLTFLVMSLIPVSIYFSEILAKKTHRRRTEAQEKIGTLIHLLSETLIGFKEIKVFLAERKVSEKFEQVSVDIYNFFLKLIKYNEGVKVFIAFITGLAGAFIFLYGAHLIKSGTITPGDFFSLFTAIVMVFTPIKKLAGAYNKFHECIAGIERIEEILKLPEEKGGKKKILQVKRGFEFHNVSFKYPGSETWALKDINITLPAGKIIAIIGKSGAGKSTFVSLLPRFFDPTDGYITLEGIDLREIDLVSLRELIGIVSQEVVVFNMSIAENIAFGKPDAAMEEIIKSAKLAYAHDFIMELPDGYDTVLGERGLNLSGGQKQRIAIARAILKDPPVLILDEATSHLDNISEKYVQKALENLMKGRTTIIIAHRLSTVKNADFVIVLDNGKVVCRGTHEFLEKNCPQYQKLYQELKK